VEAEHRAEAEWLEVQWEKEIQGEFATALDITVTNKRGMLATIASAIASEGSNIDDIRSEERDGLTSTLHLVLSVHDRKHLARIMRRLRAIPEVMRIVRDLGR
jgi:(p)ppGpp synthase/HD superfamily hydrolase